MDIHDRLDDLAQLIETARAVPLSTSCVVPRNETLDLVDDVRDALPATVSEAEEVLARRDQILEDATAEAHHILSTAESQASEMMSVAQSDGDRIIDNARLDADEMLDRARQQARQLVDEQDVMLRAQVEAQEILDDVTARSRAVIEDAQRRADEILAEAQEETSAERLATDEFVDGKLADLEESLATSLTAVRRGRDRIYARRAAFDPVDLRSSEPDELLVDQILE